MKRIGILFLITLLLISQINCSGGKAIVVSETPNIKIGDEERPSIITNSDGDLPSEKNDSQILEYINRDSIENLKFILYQNLTLKEMENEYGPIMEIAWDEGAYYKHEKLDVWVSYYYSDTFVVNFSEESYITKILGEVETYGIDYSIKGPYSILDEAKEALIFGSKCELSDLFIDVDNFSIEAFESFAIISESELWLGKAIEFDYDGLSIEIISGDDCSLRPESTAFIISSL